jgi:hypothetical protein
MLGLTAKKGQLQWRLAEQLLQLRVPRWSFFQDGDVEVGIFSEREEVSVCGFRLGAVSGLDVGSS